MAVDRFRSHPLQTSLSLAGLIVGTASIILVVTLGLTGRAFVLRQIEGVGSRLVWSNYRGTVTAGVSRAQDDVMVDEDVRAIASRSDLFSGVTGTVTLRVAGKLRHIGVGRTHNRTHVILLVQDLDVRIVNAVTGELLRELTIDLNRDYQPRK